GLLARSGAVSMIDHRASGNADAGACQPEPPAEIDIVVIREERRIESAGARVGFPRDGKRAAVGEECLGWRRELRQVADAVEVLKAARLEVQAAANEVD